MNHDDDSDLQPLEYADVVEVAWEMMIQEATIRLNAAYLQGFYEGMHAAE